VDSSNCGFCTKFSCGVSSPYFDSRPITVPCTSVRAGWVCSYPFPRKWYRAGPAWCGTTVVESFRVCSVEIMVWVVRSERGGGLCLSWIWVMPMMSSLPRMQRAACVAPGRLLVHLRVGILKFAPPCSCGDFCLVGVFFRSLEKNSRGSCSWLVPCSTLAKRACSYPTPRGWCRAGRARRLRLSFAFLIGSCTY